MDQCFTYCRELLLCHSSMPPFRVDLFNSEQMTQILSYLVNTYFRHFSLYKYIFTAQVQLTLSLSHSEISGTISGSSEHCGGDPVMQVLPIQHTENPPLSHPLLDPAPGPSDDSVPPGLLQFPLGWPPSLRHQTPPTYPECSSSSGLQPSQILTRHPPAYFPPLAACHGSHQNIGASLPSS
ncbi:coiled-coil domain-containing protein 189 isoform X2 [Conger conger]|uniref:coiled-coil domain-containing protein 189 isoform X2 n=1 Tax=Conger conger TaxID=82655 RepID=UPI002A59E252|nr:coiled-coil domain-containing protein 189 isoform X2 [Conger conger]